jgi:hypothetical protein
MKNKVLHPVDRPVGLLRAPTPAYKCTICPHLASSACFQKPAPQKILTMTVATAVFPETVDGLQNSTWLILES